MRASTYPLPYDVLQTVTAVQYTYVDGAEDTSTFCSAGAHAAAWAESASAQAVLIKGIWENTCNPLPWKGQGHTGFDTTVYEWADAYVKVRSHARLLHPADRKRLGLSVVIVHP